MLKWISLVVLVGLPAVAAVYPWAQRRHAHEQIAHRLAAVSTAEFASAEHGPAALDPVVWQRAERLAPLLASWQTVGGCGAGSSSGGGGGVKWIGHNVTGGLFGLQCMLSYTPVLTQPKGDDVAISTLVTKDLDDTWSVGVGVPFLYKRIIDPYPGLNLTLTNAGLGDVSVQGTFKFDPIHATSLTASLGLPTGTHDSQYKMRYLNQGQQLGIGTVTGSLTLDHTMDQMWGLIVVGGVVSWRGGENDINNYRAPSATGYGYAGYFWGPFVPAFGLSVTGYTGHDRDLTEEQSSPLFSVAPSLSIEWSSDLIALLLGGSLPYQYTGTVSDTTGPPQSAWGFGAWSVSLGASIAPF